MGPRHGDEVELARTIVRAAGLTALPVPPMTDPEAVLDRVLRARADHPVPAPRRRSVAVRVAAVAATVVLALGVLVTWPSSDPAAAVTPPLLDFSLVDEQELATADGVGASDVLLDLAGAASLRSPVAIDSAEQVQHVVQDRWDSVYLQDAPDTATWFVVPTRAESWLYPDGSLARSELSGSPIDQDGEAMDLADIPHLEPLGDAIDFFPPGEVEPALPALLSRDPAELREELLVDGACDPDTAAIVGMSDAECVAVLLDAVTELYDVYVVPPDLEAALWRMLADEPGLRSLGATVDRSGRDGVSIMFRHPDLPLMTVLIIDPESGGLLGQEWLVLVDDEAAGLDAPYVSGFVTHVASSAQPTDAGPVVDPRMTCEDHGSVRACSMPVAEVSP